MYVGIDQEMPALKRAWQITGRFPQKPGELLVGSDVARNLNCRVGDSVPLAGLTGKTGVVAGVLAPTHGAEDAFVYLRLDDAQRLFNHPRELTHILVRLNDPNQLDETTRLLRGCDAGMDMNVVPLAHLFRTIQTLVNSTRVLLGCVALIGLLIAAAGVANTVLMAVAERTREIGVMRALGASRADVFRLFWFETLQVCGGGAAIGIAVAFVGSRFVENWIRARLPFAPTDPLLHWQWWVMGVCFGVALVLGSFAGFLPAYRAAQLSPVEAIRAGGAGT